MILEILDIQFSEYVHTKKLVETNYNAFDSTQHILSIFKIREEWLIQSFWALSNITACPNKSILEAFLVILPSENEKLTALDRIIDFCYLSLQEIPENKKVFINSVYVLCNYLTTCNDDLAGEIRNDLIIEILVEVLIC